MTYSRRRGRNASVSNRTSASGDALPKALSPASYWVARKAIDELEACVVNASVTRDFTARNVVDCLFSEDVRRRCTDAFGYLEFNNSACSYKTPKGVGDLITRMQIEFKDLHMAPPASNLANLRLPLGFGSGIARDIQTIVDICKNFGDVRRALDWFNMNTTVGAMRYYWPTVLSLCSDAALHAASGERCKEPAGISEQLSLIRDTAATVATALMAPKVDTPPVSIWISVQTDSGLSNQFPFI